MHCNDQYCDHHHKNHIEWQSESQQPLHLKHWVVDASAGDLIVYPLNHCYFPSAGLHIEGPSLQRLFSDLQNNIRSARSLIFGVSEIIALSQAAISIEKKKVQSQKQGHVATCTILWGQASAESCATARRAITGLRHKLHTHLLLPNHTIACEATTTTNFLTWPFGSSITAINAWIWKLQILQEILVSPWWSKFSTFLYYIFQKA